VATHPGRAGGRERRRPHHRRCRRSVHAGVCAGPRADKEGGVLLAVLKHMVSRLGVPTTLALLHAYPTVTARLPLAVYEHLLLARQETSKRDRLVHAMLETLDSHLWVRRPPTVPSQFRHVRDTEQQYVP
jgi:hypothetical protein